MPQLDIAFYPAQIFWLLISFGILFFAMKFWLLPPIEKILSEREEKIKNILREADKLSAQAERISKSYQQYVDDAVAYSAKVLQSAHNEIAINYANQEEELLQILKTDTKEAQDELLAQEKEVVGKLENITFNFIRILMKVFYRLKVPERSLKKEISIFIKDRKEDV